MLSLHSPSVAVDRRQLQTIQLQQNREQKKQIRESRSSEGFIQRPNTTGFTALS